MSHAGRAVKAQYGEKMIEVRVRFWTSAIADQEDYVLPKHAQTGGTVCMARNDSHGIKRGNPNTFNSLMEIPAAIEKVLFKHGIMLHRVKKMGKYIE